MNVLRRSRAIAAAAGAATIAATVPTIAAAAFVVELVDQSAVALQDAVVYVVPVSRKVPPHGPLVGAIDQVGRQFSPRVTVLQTGTSVTFPNKDNIRHQVYSFSLPKVFELKLYSGAEAQPVVFDKPGLVVMGCNIHDRMLGFVQVVDTPWFGKSGADGVVRIDGVPNEDVTVHVWHWRATDQAEIVRTVRSAADTKLRFAVGVKPE